MSERALKKRAKKDLEELKFVLHRARKSQATEPAAAAREKGAEIEAALKAKDFETLLKKLEELEALIQDQLSRFRPNYMWETIKAFLIAVAIALFIRWAFVEPFRIPSGSMIPTLLIGDQLLVNKMTYGPDIYLPRLDPDPSPATEDRDKLQYATLLQFRLAGHDVQVATKKLWLRRPPRRGEVVVFRFPDKPREDYIKRVIGLPGDTIAYRDGRLYVNGRMQNDVRTGEYNGPISGGGCPGFDLFDEELMSDPAPVVHNVIQCRDPRYSGPYNDYPPTTVPEGEFFAMGDNRDQSSDSRAWGFVPINYVKGRALVIHLPLDPDRHYLPRWDRFFKVIK